MDLTTLLQHCLAADNTVRRPAEAVIEQTPNKVLFPPLLALLDSPLDQGTKILAFALIKSRIRASWFLRDSSRDNYFDDDIKSQIKVSLCKLLATFDDPFSQSAVINQLVDNINIILSFEQGERLQTSLQSMLIELASKLSKDQTSNVHPRDFYLNILIVSAIVKPDRFSSDSCQLFDQISIGLLPWYQWGCSVNFNSQSLDQVTQILYVLFKLFHHMTIISIPQYLCNQEHLSHLINTVTNTFNYKNIKVSKWGVKFLLNIFKKVSNKSNTLDVSVTHFLSESLAPHIINDILANHMENLCIKDQPKVRDQLTQLFMLSILNSTTYSNLKPHLEEVINKLIIPSMSITHDDVEEYEDEPLSFIGKLNNDSDTIYQQFVKLLVKHDSDLNTPIFDLVGKLLQSNDDYTIVCGLNLLVCILQLLTPEQLTQVIQLVLSINSNITHDRLWLRCYIYELLTYVKNTGLNVKIDPQVSLPLLISSLKLMIFKKMDYKVVDAMSLLLQLSSTYPLEIIYELIDLIVLHHPKEVQPFNLDLIDKLTDNFISIYQSGQQEEQLDQLVNIMNNFVTIVISINDPVSFDQINDRVAKVVNIIMSNGLLDILTEAMELLETINFMTKKVYNLEVVIDSFKNFGIDYPDLYQIYMESVYQYGQGQDLKLMNELIKWVYDQELDADAWELNEILLNVICQMAINPETTNEDLVSSEIFTKTLQTSYNLCDDKDRYFEQKLNLRCILGGFINMLPLVLELFGAQIDLILNSLKLLLNKGAMSTVFDLKSSILGLCQLAASPVMASNTANIKSSIVELIMFMINKLEPAIEHRMSLLKFETGNNTEEGEITYDDEYDELNRETKLDSINVVDIVRSTLNI